MHLRPGGAVSAYMNLLDRDPTPEDLEAERDQPRPGHKLAPPTPRWAKKRRERSQPPGR
jgi:hypothetical protein